MKYGDLPVLLALRAPHQMAIVGESVLPDIVTQTYTAADAREAVRLSRSKTIDDATIDWLLK